jgi:hypothetical protein
MQTSRFEIFLIKSLDVKLMFQNYTVHPELENHKPLLTYLKLILFPSFEMVSLSSGTLLSLALHSSRNIGFQNFTTESELRDLPADAHSSEQCSDP